MQDIRGEKTRGKYPGSGRGEGGRRNQRGRGRSEGEWGGGVKKEGGGAKLGGEESGKGWRHIVSSDTTSLRWARHLKDDSRPYLFFFYSFSFFFSFFLEGAGKGRWKRAGREKEVSSLIFQQLDDIFSLREGIFPKDIF